MLHLFCAFVTLSLTIQAVKKKKKVMKICFFDHLLLDVILKVSNSFSSNSLLCRVHNEVVPACDIVSQRMFRGGRTEYIRSPTNETVKFIGAFDDPSVSVSFQSATSAGLNLFIYF